MRVLIFLGLLAAAYAKSERCLLEPDGGMCRGYFPMYYYDAKSQTCKEFIYGGCQGNDNRFATEEECMNACRAQTLRGREREDCAMPPETGPCKANMPRYYFDKNSYLCKIFIYGGCRGNANNFKTEHECYDACGVIYSSSACQQEKVVGPCKAYFPRWFFNKETGKCERFIYGGCQGNDNNFQSKEECRAVCRA